jgi:hypothetical protein
MALDGRLRCKCEWFFCLSLTTDFFSQGLGSGISLQTIKNHSPPHYHYLYSSHCFCSSFSYCSWSCAIILCNIYTSNLTKCSQVSSDPSVHIPTNTFPRHAYGEILEIFHGEEKMMYFAHMRWFKPWSDETFD